VTTPALDDLREKVDRFLREMAPNVSVDDAGDFMLDTGGAITWIRPLEWSNARTLVRVWAITNVGVDADGGLPRFLLEANAKIAIGGFRLDERGPAVVLVHSLLGDYLNRAELGVAVGSVAGTAAEYAPQIKERFGGKLFTES
jgi:hypothetical protein